MSEVAVNLRNIRFKLRAGVCGQREVWEQQLEEAIVEIERINTSKQFQADVEKFKK